MPKLEFSEQKFAAMKWAEEHYNALRTNVQLSGENLKVIMVTSVQPNEGKSTTTINLAVAFARSGYKTLIVDADLRNSTMSGIFKSRERYTGLTDFLSGGANLSHGLCETSIENLFIIQAGQNSPNPTALLQSKNFVMMLDILRKYYDYIIIDTPPIGLVIDAAIVAQSCDASLLVTESGAIRRRYIKEAKKQLEQTGTPFLGIILNKFDTKLDNYGGYRNYGEYGNYGRRK